MANRTGAHYDSTTIGLHWVTAGMAVVLWGGAEVADFIPKGVWRTNGWTLHVALGFALVTVLVWRLVWRFTGRRRLPAADSNRTVHLAAEASHYALYALLFATVGLGVIDAFGRGFSLTDVTCMPAFGDKDTHSTLALWHGVVADLLIAVAFWHAAAALAHHYLLKDGVLMRMAPERHPVPEERLEATDPLRERKRSGS
ncbi:MAG: cytochrome b [Methylocella sp.]